MTGPAEVAVVKIQLSAFMGRKEKMIRMHQKPIQMHGFIKKPKDSKPDYATWATHYMIGIDNLCQLNSKQVTLLMSVCWLFSFHVMKFARFVQAWC